MIGDAPPFWWVPGDWRGHALAPLSWIYGAVAKRRLGHEGAPAVDAPVICVGNFTVGGSGKTPTVIALARHARSLGFKPVVVTRGHGGSLSGPHRVDPAHDDARSVGDEAMLIARHCAVMVSVDRAAGARIMVEAGHDLVILDDGLQSRRIAFDYVLVVADAGRGVGNGYVLPAGPLRAPLKAQLPLADALLVMGEGPAADPLVRRFAKAAKPVFTASLKARNVTKVRRKRLLAFAGIGDPDRFFATLEALGGDVVRSRAFPDHYPFRDDDLVDLMREADDNGLVLATTEKDAVRIAGHSEAALAIRQRLVELPVFAEFGEALTPDRIIADARKAFAARQAPDLRRQAR